MDENRVRTSEISQVKITGGLFGKISSQMRQQVIPYMWDILNDRNAAAPDHSIENFTMAEDKGSVEYPSHCITNFKIAAGLEKGKFYGMVFQDSDVYKWIEAVAYQLMSSPDEKLEQEADEAIEIIAKAQQPDGYIDTYFILVEPDKKFTNLCECHELYCAGHLVEAATAYYKATGKKKLLDVACRMIDLIDSRIGPEEGKIHGYPGHEEIELSLVKLYGVTKKDKYIRLAKYFIDERGKQPHFFDEEIKKRNYATHFGYMNPPYGMYSYGAEYEQWHKPIRNQEAFEGHAVRCMYMASAVADLARVLNDESLRKTAIRLYENMAQRRIYITGGIGSSHIGERFTYDYDLPNDTMYAETCASVGVVFFMQRMLLLEQDSRYADTMERALYNTCIAGKSLDGKNFFYVNPLEVNPEGSKHNPDRKHVLPERPAWFGCACCPPNLARLVSALGSYIYIINNDRLYMNLYMQNKLTTNIGGSEVSLNVVTNYPEDGTVSIDFNCDSQFNLCLRIPSWSSENYSITVNGENRNFEYRDGYVMLTQHWKKGDNVGISFDMTPRRMYANSKVAADVGKVAIQRGPLVYCIEEADNGKSLQSIFLPKSSALEVVDMPDKLDGIKEIHSEGIKVISGKEDELYSDKPEFKYGKVPLVFIPYYTWANRGSGEMTVWLHEGDPYTATDK